MTLVRSISLADHTLLDVVHTVTLLRKKIDSDDLIPTVHMAQPVLDLDTS